MEAVPGLARRYQKDPQCRAIQVRDGPDGSKKAEAEMVRKPFEKVMISKRVSGTQ